MKSLQCRLTTGFALFAVVGLLALMALGCKPKSQSARAVDPVANVTPEKRARLDWNLVTLVDAYGKAGHTDPSWDAAAKSALQEYARVRSHVVATNEQWRTIIRHNCETAIKAGCDDPMIRYLQMRYSDFSTNGPEAHAEEFSRVARDMHESSYHHLRKFYASLRAVDQLYKGFGTNVDRELLSATAANIKSSLKKTARDKDVPFEEVYEAGLAGIKAYRGKQNVYEELEPILAERWTNQAGYWALKGEAYMQKAWNSRGYNYAEKVSQAGWEGYYENLALAEKALDQAWELDPKDPHLANIMVHLEHAQGKGRERMELWFQRAMAVDPNDYETCSVKLSYLEPKWHGSAEEMLAFGRECVRSKNWGDRIPLILVDAHAALARYEKKSERAEYWKRDEVWPDLKAAFEKFFKLNPDDDSHRQNYTRYAYRCEQWDDLNRQLKLLGPINYAYFGGREKFDEMVRLAKEHATGAKSGNQK